MVASGRDQRGTQIPRERNGANDALHQEHLMAPARQLTSPASTLRAKWVVFHFSQRQVDHGIRLRTWKSKHIAHAISVGRAQRRCCMGIGEPARLMLLALRFWP